VGTFGGYRVVSHSGAYGGYRSTYLRFPEEHLSVITLCNVSTMSSQLAERVGSLFLSTGIGEGVDPFPSSLPRIVPATPDPLKGVQNPDEQVWMEGKYFSPELGMEITLRSQNSSLVVRRPGADDLVFTRLARDVFTNTDQMSLNVERDSFGTVSGFTLSTSRVRNLRFLKITGVVGAFGGYY
jgi:hypothetical protein